MIVLDASAVLALLQDEAGADVVEDAIDGGAIISAVNLAEVLAKMADAGVSVDRAADLVLGLFVEVEPCALPAAVDSARIRDVTARWGLSLGDRVCLSLARSRALPLVTADRAWSALAEPLDVTVHTIR